MGMLAKRASTGRVLGLCTCLLTARLFAEDAPVLFETHVRPLLERSCFACHSTGKRKHGLDVRQQRTLVRGGDSGPAIVPGAAGTSRLLSRVRAGEMPPGDRKKLTGDEVALIERWISEGARTRESEAPIPESPDEYLTPEDRSYWAFQPLAAAPTPQVPAGAALNSIDAHVLGMPGARDVVLEPEAPPEKLARRAWLDLLGIPPPIEELDRFLADGTPGAYERLVDRLLASPLHGERWGRHWLDAAGYADSNGGNDTDELRPEAWRYRDYVIRAFNADKPFGQFLEEQLAGDELAGYPAQPLTPERIELLAATGYLRMAADGTGQSDSPAARNQVIADTLTIFGSGVLGLTLGCAQCHDHRYDPISQRDYHRLRAALEPAYNPEAWRPPGARRISLATEEDRKRTAEVEARAAARRAERNALEARLVHAVVEKLCAEKLPEAVRARALAAFDTPADKRSAEDRTLFEEYPFLKISGGTLYQYDPEADKKVKELDAEVARIGAERPPEELLSALWEEPGRIPPSRLLLRGQPDQPAEEVPPGIPAVFLPPGKSPDLAGPPTAAGTSGRRLRLAAWLVSPENPLVWRVAANRIWHHHFGVGLVATPGDFGRQGEPPAHRELLDFLARELARGGGSWKALHRLILTSRTYRQACNRRLDEQGHDGALAGRRTLVRLEAEALRDTILALSGALCLRAGGPPVPVREDADGSIVVGIDRKAESNRPGAEVPIGAEEFRRTVYVTVRRSQPLSFAAAFDAPPLDTNCTRRATTLVAPQALFLLNGPLVRQEAARWARRLLAEAGTPEARVRLAFRQAYSRPPRQEELSWALEYLETEAAMLAPPGAAAGTPADPAAAALERLCHVILNTSELLFVD